MKDDANGYPQGSLVGDCDNKKTYIVIPWIDPLST